MTFTSVVGKFKEEQQAALAKLRNPKYFTKFYSQNMRLTKQAIKESVNEDSLIMQTISNMQELDKSINLHTKRLKEWYSLYLPELSQRIDKHETFVELVVGMSRKELMEQEDIKETMGADLAKKDVIQIGQLASCIKGQIELRESHEKYLKSVMKKYCPNLMELAGVTIAAKLLQMARGLKHLATMPASTIQLLGAEKALFRHIKTGARSPKYGILITHPLVARAKRSMKGKAARMLADKLSLCARIDYFKGEFRADVFAKELEEKLK